MTKKEVLAVIEQAKDDEWTTLDLSYKNLSVLPQEIGQLTHLEKLDISNNQLTQLPCQIGQLTHLVEFSLYNNMLSELPDEIGELTHLQSLNLFNNQLTGLSKEIAKLKKLRQLNLYNNKLTTLPWVIIQLPKLKVVDLRNNPLESPLLHIVNQGIDALFDYLQSLDEKVFVYEAKLIIVGNPRVGKTSLAKKLIDPDYFLDPKEPVTHGINICLWPFSFKDNIVFRTNIWDFGGQEIMHATHKYFLTRRSLYIVLTDNRKEDTDFYCYLHMVELLSGKSPVLVVLNEKNGDKKIIPNEIKKTFTSIKEVFTINLATNRGLSDLMKAIMKYMPTLPHIEKEPIPKKWVHIREELENTESDYISLEQYNALYNSDHIHFH